MAPDLTFLLLTSPALKSPLSTARNVIEQTIPVGANTPGTMWMLPEFAPLSGVDVFHATYNTLPARLPMRTVTTIHDLMWLTNPEWCDASPYRQVKQWFYAHGIRRAIAKSDRIATVSAATRSAILAYEPEAAERIEVTRSGVSERFKPTQADPALLHQLGVPDQRRFALVVGQFAPYKNHEGALEGFAKGLADDAQAHIVFVQRQGQRSTSLAKLAVELGMADRVTFTGPVTEHQLISLYSAAEFLLHPSYCEGFGNPVAEAMACGCPVITSDRSAMPEVAGGAAILVDPYNTEVIANSVRDLWNTEAKRDALRQSGVARARALDWVSFARANVNIYRSLLVGN